MKKTFILLWIILLCCCVAGCSASTADADRPAASHSFAQITYTHYSSGGTPEEYPAIILFEQSISTFTSYQVAFCSCTCRDSLVNYYSVCYVEMLNTKPTADQASIRAISFGNNQGLYGDSNPNYYKHEFTEEYMDEYFVQQLVHASKSDFDAWEGYGTQLDCIDADALAGASVSTGNITSVLRSLFEYHADKYYAEPDGQ